AVYCPGDKELKPLFDWMLLCLLPRLFSPDTPLSFLPVPSFAPSLGPWFLASPFLFSPSPLPLSLPLSLLPSSSFPPPPPPPLLSSLPLPSLSPPLPSSRNFF
ncbi:hypothetical protein N5V54_22025, partial [Escherichia coli]|nr:hypothetical protein [Escherichia coli]